LKYSLNPIPCLSSSWLFSRRQSEKDTSVLKNVSRPTLIPMATLLTLPIFVVAMVAEPATAWQTEANVDHPSNPEVRPPQLPIDPVIHHRIASGDTLWELAQQYDISAQALAKHNAIPTEALLQIGEILEIPVSTVWQLQVPQVVSLPVGGIGGAISPDKIPLNSFATNTTVSVVPRVISSGTSSRIDESEIQLSEQPIQQFLADVDELRANYEQGSGQSPERVNWDGNNPSTANSSGKAFSPFEPSANESNPNSLATAPIKVEFYNPSLSAPIGETVSPELPPLSSPDQYLPNSQKFNGYIWPAEGVFTSGYGMRWGRMHRGIDIAAPIGTPIVAAAPGEVVVAGWNSGGYGNLVKLKHPDGSLTLYAHNNKVLVQKGQEVDQGQQIAEMGNTGRSTGPHLHFEIHPKDQGAKNPLAYLPKR